MGKDNNDVKGKFKILITILLPILAIIIPIALYMLQLQDKIFTYEIFSYSLINFSSSIEDEVEIRFSGKKVTDLTAINIVMKNAGDVPIRKEDFERNIAIGFGEEAKILKTIVKYKFPSNLVPIVNNKENSIQITPLLLNPGDHFSIETIVSKTSSDPIFDARIAGIKNPTKINIELYSGSRFSNRTIVFFACAFLMIYSFLVSLSLVVLRPSIRKQKILRYQPAGILALLSALCGAYLIVRYRIPDFALSLSLMFEILLYLSVILLGTIAAYFTTKRIRSNQNNDNDRDEKCISAQPSARPDCE